MNYKVLERLDFLKLNKLTIQYNKVSNISVEKSGVSADSIFPNLAYEKKSRVYQYSTRQQYLEI